MIFMDMLPEVVMGLVDLELDKVADEVADIIMDIEADKVAQMVVKIPNEDFTGD